MADRDMADRDDGESPATGENYDRVGRGYPTQSEGHGLYNTDRQLDDYGYGSDYGEFGPGRASGEAAEPPPEPDAPTPPPVGYAPGMVSPEAMGADPATLLARALSAAAPGAFVKVDSGAVVASLPDGRVVTMLVSGEGEDTRFTVTAPGVPPELGGLQTPSLDQAIAKARVVLGLDRGETEPDIGPGI